MTKSSKKIASLVRDLYAVVGQLERLHPERKFTPDGHLVGSIGEVLVAEQYGLELLPASTPTHDAEVPGGPKVQIKATQGSKVGLRGKPQHLIVVKLEEDGSITEVYNGPGGRPWNQAGKMQSNGQRFIGVAKLRGLQDLVPETRRLSPSLS